MTERSCDNCMYRRVCDTPRSCGDMAWVCGTYSHSIDRDALLALADEIERDMATIEHYDMKVRPIAVAKYARRIREALGENNDY